MVRYAIMAGKQLSLAACTWVLAGFWVGSIRELQSAPGDPVARYESFLRATKLREEVLLAGVTLEMSETTTDQAGDLVLCLGRLWSVHKPIEWTRTYDWTALVRDGRLRQESVQSGQWPAIPPSNVILWDGRRYCRASEIGGQWEGSLGVAFDESRRPLSGRSVLFARGAWLSKALEEWRLESVHVDGDDAFWTFTFTSEVRQGTDIRRIHTRASIDDLVLRHQLSYANSVAPPLNEAVPPSVEAFFESRSAEQILADDQTLEWKRELGVFLPTRQRLYQATTGSTVVTTISKAKPWSNPNLDLEAPLEWSGVQCLRIWDEFLLAPRWLGQTSPMNEGLDHPKEGGSAPTANGASGLDWRLWAFSSGALALGLIALLYKRSRGG